MTLRDLLDGVVYAGTIAGALAAIAWVVSRAFLRPLDRRIERIAAPLRQANQQLHPNGGVDSEHPTMHDYAKAAADRAQQALEQIDKVSKVADGAQAIAEANTRLIVQNAVANAAANEASRRALEEHTKEHP